MEAIFYIKIWDMDRQHKIRQSFHLADMVDVGWILQDLLSQLSCHHRLEGVRIPAAQTLNNKKETNATCTDSYLRMQLVRIQIYECSLY